MKRSRSAVALLALTACMAYPAAAFGGDAAAPAGNDKGPLSLTGSGDPAATVTADAPPPGPPGPPPPGFISGFVDLEVATHYYKRGFLQENKGLIFEPIVDLSINPFHSDGPLTSLSFNIGTRSSIHSADSHAQGSPRCWYEQDFFGGINAVFFKRFKLDTTYVAIDSPNNGFDTIHEFDFQLTYIDDGMFGPFTFHPYVTAVQEIKNSAAAGPEGTYLEFGIEPAFPVIQSKMFPVRLSFPTRVGLSTNSYYKLMTPFGTLTSDETFGYAQTGITAMMPVTFIPHDYGMVFLSGGVDFLFLDHNLQLVNHNQGNAVIGRIGLVWAF